MTIRYTERRAPERAPLLNEALRRELIEGGVLKPSSTEVSDVHTFHNVADAPVLRISSTQQQTQPARRVGQ